MKPDPTADTDTDPVVLAGRYRLRRLLGRGGMAEVHLGHDLELDRRVAVKLLPRAVYQDERQIDRLRREARAAASLNHPAVVGVHDIGESNEHVFVVMEYIEGESLRQRLRRRGRLDAGTAERIAVEVCGALAAAHSEGVVHRDVNPGNIMIRSDGSVKLLDFGVALTADPGFATEAGVVLGTPAYLAPEQVEGGKLDGRCDIYSIGCCLYEMLTGRRPFVADSPAALAYQHVHAAPDSPRMLDPEIGPRMAATILRALAKDPDDRHRSAAELVADLTSADPQAVQPTGEDAPERATDPAATNSCESTSRTPPAAAQGPVDTDTRPIERRRPAAMVGSAKRQGTLPRHLGIDQNELREDTRATRRRALGMALVVAALAAIVIAVLVSTIGT